MLLLLKKSSDRVENSTMIRVYWCFLAFALSLAQLRKEIRSDLASYLSHYGELYKDFAGFYWHPVKFLDLGFYLPSAGLAHISGGSESVFVFFWSVIIYLLIFSAIAKSCEYRGHNSIVTIGVLTYSAFMGISFDLVTHLLRQNIGVGILVFALAHFPRNRAALTVSLIGASFIHFQFFFAFIAMFVGWHSVRFLVESNVLKRVFVFWLIIAILGLSYVLALVMPELLSYACSFSSESFLPFFATCARIETYLDPFGEVGFLSFRGYLTVGLIYIIFLISFVQRGVNQAEAWLLFFATILLSMSLAMSFSDVASQRVFLTLSMLSAVLIPSIVPRVKENLFSVLVLLICLISIFRWLRADFIQIF
jgi:hypothetical protein